MLPSYSISASLFLRSSDATQQTVMKRSQASHTPSESANNTGLTTMSLMELEMNESLENSSTDDVDTFRKTCREIQILVAEIDDLKAKKNNFEVEFLIHYTCVHTLMHKDRCHKRHVPNHLFWFLVP